MIGSIELLFFVSDVVESQVTVHVFLEYTSLEPALWALWYVVHAAPADSAVWRHMRDGFVPSRGYRVITDTAPSATHLASASDELFVVLSVHESVPDAACPNPRPSELGVVSVQWVTRLPHSVSPGSVHISTSAHMTAARDTAYTDMLIHASRLCRAVEGVEVDRAGEHTLAAYLTGRARRGGATGLPDRACRGWLFVDAVQDEPVAVGLTFQQTRDVSTEYDDDT